MKKLDPKVDVKSPECDPSKVRLPYQPPQVVKKRAVARATLFSGSGEVSGGIIAS